MFSMNACSQQYKLQKNTEVKLFINKIDKIIIPNNNHDLNF